MTAFLDWQATDDELRELPWMLVGVFLLVYGMLSGQMVSGKSIAFYSVAFGSFSFPLSTFVTCMGTFSRRPVLAQELLRPMRRSDMIQHLRSSMLYDLRPAFIVALCYLLSGWGASFYLPISHCSW